METNQNKTQSYSFFEYYRYIEGSFKFLLVIGMVNAVTVNILFNLKYSDSGFK